MRYVVGLLLVGLLAVRPSPVRGQAGRQYGLTLGVNRGAIKSPDGRLGGHFGFVLGGVVRQPLYASLAVQSGLLLSQKGTEVRNDEGGAIEYQAGYIELPLLLHLEAPLVQSMVVYGEVGGFGAVKLFERQTPGEGNLNVALRTGRTFFQRFNAGLLAGIGATIPIRDQRLNVTVRREWGLPDVARNVENQPFPQVSFPREGRTRTWSLLLRFGF
ncbi:MAG: porin family protein [Salinibacter sp.]